MTREDFRLILEKALLRCGRTFGYELKPIIARPAPAIDILGLAIRELMSREPDIFFVQIGAHDGRSFDPISPYVRKQGWRGLLIEPQPDIFARLQKNYEGQTGLIFENVAIGAEEGTLTLYRFKHATADNHASMLASSRRHYLQLNGDGERGDIEPLEVPVTPLGPLLDRHGITRVDLLQIDTEGYDFPILKALDFTRLKPQIIHFENNFLHRNQKQELAELFSAQGYAVMDLGIDTVAYLQPVDTDFEERMTQSKVVAA